MAAALTEDLVEEVLLRFPADNPASLVRAALVSKRWCRLIAGRGFRRRFRELHGAGPMLGFICNVVWDEKIRNSDARLVPSSSSCLPRADHHGQQALDSRHGRVILCGKLTITAFGINPLEPLVLWNPVTREHLELPSLPLDRCSPPPFSFNATVLCAGGDACDHLDDDCYHGRFLVVFVGTYVDGLFTYVYSSDAGTWSEPSIVNKRCDDMIESLPAALVGNAVYFLFTATQRIVKYDLGTCENSFIHMPPESCGYGRTILMTTEQGKLGLARVSDFELYLWSMEVGPQGDAVWTQDWVFQLQNLLPADALWIPPHAVGCVHGRGMVLVGTGEIHVVLFAIDPKANKAIKVGEGIKDDVNVGFHYFNHVVPYTSF